MRKKGLKMNRSNPAKTKSRFERLMIWSILYQDQVAHHVRLLIGGGAAIAALMAMARIISLDAALRLIFYGGVIFSCVLWIFIQKRRSWLLGITDPDLKREAYAVMLAYLTAKGYRAESEKSVTGRSEHKQDRSTCQQR
jgi:predicted lysophospholipase L1 biosynthesis ABC-type transport system permease subunit